jgi:acyl-CoA thioesterase YciA
MSDADRPSSSQPPAVPGGPHLRTVAMPRDANPSGDVFGGWTLSQMDSGGRHLRGREGGRAGRDGVDRGHDLPAPGVGGRRGVLLLLAVEAGDTSLTVRIETWARGRGGAGGSEKVTEGTFKFAAIDENGKPRPLPNRGGEG